MAGSFVEAVGRGAEEAKSSSEMVCPQYSSLLSLSTVVHIRAFGLLCSKKACLDGTRERRAP